MSIENPVSPESPKKKFRIMVEMEGYGKDGEEITGTDLWEEVVVEAKDADEAYEMLNDMDFGNRRIAGVEPPEEVQS